MFFPIFSGVLYETRRAVELFHDRITGINALSAVDAFKLSPPTDVDACWADLDTMVAVHTIPLLATRDCTKSGLASFFIVSDDKRVIIHHHRLNPAIGTHDDAKLLPEPAKVEEENPCKNHGGNEESPVLSGSLKSNEEKIPWAYDIADEGMGYMKRNQKENKPLDSPF